MEQRILLIEDSPEIAKSIQLSMRSEGFFVEHVASLTAARKFAPFTGFHLALVDVNLPDGNGLEFCTEIRVHNSAMPIVIITARADEEALVSGLAVATDYVRKPFGKRELLARVRKALGQVVSTERVIDFEGLRLKANDKSASFGGTVIPLRPKEFAILSVLAVHGGDVVTRDRILQNVDQEGGMFERSLDSHLSRLRKAFKDAGVREFELVAVPGTGYVLRRCA